MLVRLDGSINAAPARTFLIRLASPVAARMEVAIGRIVAWDQWGKERIQVPFHSDPLHAKGAEEPDDF